MISGVVVLLAISVWPRMSYIPDQMKRAMNHFGAMTQRPRLPFVVSEGAVLTTATPGKILVIDFLWHVVSSLHRRVAGNRTC